MNDTKTTDTPLTHEKMMAALAESSERMNNLSASERQELHQHALKLIYAGAEIKELEETKKLLTAAQLRLEASELREAELAKALKEFGSLPDTQGHSYMCEYPEGCSCGADRWNLLVERVSDLLSALQSPASQNNPKETKE